MASRRAAAVQLAGFLDVRKKQKAAAQEVPGQEPYTHRIRRDEDAEGQRHEMVGLLSLETSFARRKLHLGYRRALLHSTCPIGTVGEEVLGHEFHYACTASVSDPPLAECRDAQGAPVDEAGARRASVSGTFFHAIDKARPEHQ